MTENQKTWRKELNWNLQATRAVFKRDVKVFWKNIRGNLIRILGQPLFFLAVFGFLLPRMNVFRTNYTAILIPGLISMATMMGSMRSAAAEIGIGFDHDEEIRAHVLLPLSMRSLALEKIIYGMIQGLFSGVAMLIISLVLFPQIFSFSLLSLFLTFLALVASGIIFGSLGLAIGSIFQPPEIMFEVLFVLITPMMFFGATFYPVSMIGQIHQALIYVTLLIPLAHVSELIRISLTGGGYFPTLIYMLGTLFFVSTLVPLGIWAFRRRAIS